MRMASLDLGDRWIGSAISDPLGFIAKPFKTVIITELHNLIKELTTELSIKHIVIGYPKTMRGTESEQTKKILNQKQLLQETYPTIIFVLWDERLTSKHASQWGSSLSKEDKIKSHSLAAALILDSFLQSERAKQLRIDI